MWVWILGVIAFLVVVIIMAQIYMFKVGVQKMGEFNKSFNSNSRKGLS